MSQTSTCSGKNGSIWSILSIESTLSQRGDMPRLTKVVASGALHKRHCERSSALLLVVFSATTPLMLKPEYVRSRTLDPLMDLCKPPARPFDRRRDRRGARAPDDLRLPAAVRPGIQRAVPNGSPAPEDVGRGKTCGGLRWPRRRSRAWPSITCIYAYQEATPEGVTSSNCSC